MPTRLLHAAISFAIVVVVYQAYVVLAVPLIDPLSNDSSDETAAPQPSDQARPATHKYRALLSAYFPPDHWSLQRPPKTFENGQAMIVLDEYDRNKEGRIRVDRCVMVFFPRARVPGEPPPRDAVVLEAAHGAVLKLDEAAGSQLSGVGRVEWAKLLGEIVVRSDMQELGPHDDLLITTHDLDLNEEMIRTDARVQLQLGPHRARGRVLEIRLVSTERAESGSTWPNIGGIDSLDVKYDVQAELAIDSSGLSKTTTAGVQELNPKQSEPPLQITSRGPFSFDFLNHVATFSEQVRVEQLHPNDQRDMLACESLKLYFSSKVEMIVPRTGSPSDIGPTTADTSELKRLRPGSIEANGAAAAPIVVLDAPSRGAAAECERLRIELEPRRVTLNGKQEVTLRYRESEIHAPMVQYQHPPEGSTDRIGRLLAAGGGWLRSTAGREQSGEPFEVRWTRKLQIVRENGQPVLSLQGRPRMTMVGLGRLWADELRVYLRERIEGAADADSLPADIVPDRISATGQVAIDSAELAGKVDQLGVRIDYLPDNIGPGLAPDGRSGVDRFVPGGPGGLASRSYDISGKELNVRLLVQHRNPTVSEISVRGDVVFREMAKQANAIQPLEVHADWLRVEDTDSPAAKIEIDGWPAGVGRDPRPAQISAQGVTISAAKLRLDRGTSRAHIDGPGELEMSVDRDLAGNPLAQSQPLKIVWRRAMELDQDRLTFQGKVVARSSGGILQTERLVAQLSAPVKFDGGATGRKPQLAQIECSDGVVADITQRDQVGPTSIQHLQLESFSVNQINGRIAGVGPGLIQSVQLAGNVDLLPTSAGPASANRPSSRSDQQLRFLQVNFSREVQGDLHSRRIEIIGQVKAIYGPIDSWEQRLERALHQGPGPDTVWIDCDRLSVAENPLARVQGASRMGPVEVQAKGHVIIEGRTPKGGTFTARGERAAYDQQKTKFLLEGGSHAPATLAHRPFPGGPVDQQSFRKFTYIQATDETKIEDATLQFNQFGPERQPIVPPR